MAKHLTDREKKKIIADYVELGSYNAVAKKHGVSDNTVRNIVLRNSEISEKFERKKEEDTADILAHMEGQKEKVCLIMDLYLDELLNVKQFKSLTPNQLTTALGTLIDKWTAIGGGPGNTGKEDELSRSLKELGRELESDAD